MPSRHSFLSSSVGSKYLIAFTGLSLVGFLIGHLAGNLLVYVSPDAFNHYADALIKNPLLIPAELGLVALFLLHAYKTVRMFLGANEARPVGYAKKEWAGHTSRKSWASTTMILSGLFLLVFVPFHLKTFKYGPHYESAEPGVRDLWRTGRGGLQPSRLRRLLRRRHGDHRLPPLARRVERAAVAGHRSARLVAGAAPDRVDGRRRARRRLPEHPALLLPSRGAVMTLDSKIPGGPLADKWDRHKFEVKLVNPANKRKFTVIVVGTGLAGASAAASLGELGYNVLSLCIHDSPRRAHSIAAQGGINAAKNYKNDGDSVYRLFYDTIKGGDYRAREANVHRLAQLSVNIIDQCVAQGVPFAREYGGLLDNRSFGGAQVSRTFYARGQTGQQLLLGAYQALMRQVEAGIGDAAASPRDARPGRGRRQGARHRLPQPDDRRDRDVRRARGAAGDRRLRHGVLPVDQRRELERHGGLARAQARGAVCQPVLHADPSDVHPGQRRPSEQADADERVAAQRRTRLGAEEPGRRAGRRTRFPKAIATTTSNGSTRASATWCRATSRRATPSRCATRAAASGDTRLSVYLDFADAITRLGADTIKARYGNLFDMYKRITDEDPYKVPMRIYPAIHYTMGGLWVDYNLMSNLPGLHVLGEANFSDHGANRLGASALMQGLGDGYFVIPYTLGHYLAGTSLEPVTTAHDAFGEAAASATAHAGPAAGGQGQALDPRLPSRDRAHPLGQGRHVAHRRRPATGGRRDPHAARRVLAGRLGAGRQDAT